MTIKPILVRPRIRLIKFRRQGDSYARQRTSASIRGNSCGRSRTLTYDLSHVRLWPIARFRQSFLENPKKTARRAVVSFTQFYTLSSITRTESGTVG